MVYDVVLLVLYRIEQHSIFWRFYLQNNGPSSYGEFYGIWPKLYVDLTLCNITLAWITFRLGKLFHQRLELVKNLLMIPLLTELFEKCNSCLSFLEDNGGGLGNFVLLFITTSGTISENPTVVLVDHDLFVRFVVYSYPINLKREIKKFIWCGHVFLVPKLFLGSVTAHTVIGDRFRFGMSAWPTFVWPRATERIWVDLTRKTLSWQ